MQEYYYILKSKLNFKLQQSVIDGDTIRLNGYDYIRLISKPIGRTIKHRLLGQESNDKFIIYN